MTYRQPEPDELNFTLESYSNPDNNDLTVRVQGFDPVMEGYTIASGGAMPPSMTESGANIMLNYGASQTDVDVRNLIGESLSSNSQNNRASGYSPTPTMDGFYFIGSGQNLRARSIKDSSLKGQVQNYYGSSLSSFSVADGAVLASTEPSNDGDPNQHHTVIFEDLTKGDGREKFTISRGLYSCPFYPLIDNEAIYQVSDDGVIMKIPGEDPQNEIKEDTSVHTTGKVDIQHTGDLTDHVAVADPGNTAPSTVWENGGSGGISTTYRDGHIYYQDTYNIRCYDAYTGEQIWANGAGDGSDMYTQVILENRNVIVTLGYQGVQALDLDTGDIEWEITGLNTSSTNYNIARDSNENIYTEQGNGTFSATLMKIDPDGNILWQSTWNTSNNENPNLNNVVVVEDKGMVMAGGSAYLVPDYGTHELLAWWDMNDGTVINDDDGTHLGGGTGANYNIADRARWVHHPSSDTVIIPSNHGSGPTCISGWPDDPTDGRTDKWRIGGFNHSEGALVDDIYYQHFHTSGSTYNQGDIAAFDISGGSPTELWRTETGITVTGWGPGYATSNSYICPMGDGVMFLDRDNGEIQNFLTPFSGNMRSLSVSAGGVFCASRSDYVYSIGGEVQ